MRGSQTQNSMWPQTMEGTHEPGVDVEEVCSDAVFVSGEGVTDWSELWAHSLNLGLRTQVSSHSVSFIIRYLLPWQKEEGAFPCGLRRIGDRFFSHSVPL